MDKKPFKKINPAGGKNGGPKRNMKNAGFIALLVLFGLIVFSSTNKPETLKDVPFSGVVKSANKGDVKQIEISGNELKITNKGEDKPSQKSRKEAGSTLLAIGFLSK